MVKRNDRSIQEIVLKSKNINEDDQNIKIMKIRHFGQIGS